MNGTVSELRNELEEALRGDCSCDYITKQEWMDTMEDFDRWAEKAENGESYYYNGSSYTLEEEKELEEE